MNKRELIKNLEQLGVELKGTETKAELQEAYDKVADAISKENTPSLEETTQIMEDVDSKPPLTAAQKRNMSHQQVRDY